MPRSLLVPAFRLGGLLLTLTLGLVGCGHLLSVGPEAEVIPQNNLNAYYCSCDCESASSPTSPPGSAITTGSDDGVTQQITNGFQTVLDGPAPLDLGKTFVGSAGQIEERPTTVVLRFQALGIPVKSQVTSASIQFWAADNSADESHLAIDVLLVPDAGPLTNIDYRTLTGYSGQPIQWAPNSWAKDDHGPDQQTPDLHTLLQKIVDHPQYTPKSAVMFVIGPALGAVGQRSAISYENSMAQGDVRPQAPTLNFQYVAQPAKQDFLVCKSVPDEAAAQADCASRVRPTVQDLAGECKIATPCTCNFKKANNRDVTSFSDACNKECTLVPHTADCNPEDFRKATGTADTQCVILGTSPIGSSLFGRRSFCDLNEGESTVTIRFVDDDGDADQRTRNARGRVEIVGAPCPDHSCEVGMTYRLHINDILIPNFFGDNTFTQLSGVGESTSSATLDHGAGAFGFESTVNWVRGHHNESNTTTALLGRNVDPITVGLGNWQPGGVCTVQGNLVGTANPRNVCSEGPRAGATCGSAADCGVCSGHPCACSPLSDGVTMGVNLRGTLVNQPPTAVAGPDQTVECNDTGRGAFFLDATASGDPDNNVTFWGWFRGSRTGDLVGVQPRIALAQNVDGTVPYVFKVVDALGQYDDSITHVTVVDTTPPKVTAPDDKTAECTGPQGTPVALGNATAIDICDASPALGNDALPLFALGTTTVTWSAKDAHNNIGSDTQVVRIVDTTPPTLAVTLSPSVLWSPTHKLVTINASITVQDVCDPNPAVRLVSIVSNEPDEGLGDGDMPHDIQAAFNTDARSFQVRAERRGFGTDRIYTVTYEAADASGNTTRRQATVTVPRDRR
jgi:hypothetical protein